MMHIHMRSRVFWNFKSVFLLAAIVLIATTAAVAQSRKDREQARALEQQADRAYNLKNYREAADKYGQSVTLVSKNPNVHYRKGFAHYNLKEHSEAVKALDTALDQGFKPPVDVYRIRHLVHMDSQNYDAALADIETGLKMAPADLNFLSSRGEILFERKAYPEALAVFQEIVKLNPNSADT
jgi:tetratricopeptide (TPR) repeat protein